MRRNLTEDQVRQIRTLYINGSKPNDLAEKFNVNIFTIQNVLTRRTYKKVI